MKPILTSDDRKLVSSARHAFPVMDADGEPATIIVWVKAYASGRIRVVLPEGYTLVGFMNGGNTPDLKIELWPAPKTRRSGARGG